MPGGTVKWVLLFLAFVLTIVLLAMLQAGSAEADSRQSIPVFLFLGALTLFSLWRIALSRLPQQQGIVDAAADTVTFPRFRPALLVNFLLCAAFTYAGYGFAEDQHTARAWVVFGIFVGLTVVSRAALLARRPIVLGPDGIAGVDRSGHAIPWDDVGAVTLQNPATATVITLQLRPSASKRTATIFPATYRADPQAMLSRIEERLRYDTDDYADSES